MTDESKPLLKVERMSDGEKVFLLEDIRFDTFPTEQLMHALQRNPVIDVKVIRGGEVVQTGYATYDNPGAQGGGSVAIFIFGTQFVGSISATVFQPGDEIYFDQPVPGLRDALVDRWYGLQIQMSPWKEENQQRHAASVDATIELSNKFHESKLNEREYTEQLRAQGARSDASFQEMWDRLRKEVPLPMVLHFR